MSEISDEMVRAFRIAERTALGFRKKPAERVRAGLAAVEPLLRDAVLREALGVPEHEIEEPAVDRSEA